LIDHQVLTDDQMKEDGMGWVCDTLWGNKKMNILQDFDAET